MQFQTESFDARAEGGRRRIEITAERVTISRRVDGVEMRVGLSPRQYRGLGLCVLVSEGTDFLYQVRLVHADSDLDVTLGAFDDETEARTIWRRLAAALRLSRLVEREDGAFEIERAPVAAPVERRRGSATLRRRNRFLARRKMGRIDAPPPRALDA